MLSVRCCAQPPPKEIRLPKRLARARRVMESKRLDSFREVHEVLKKTAHEEQKFLRDFFDRMKEAAEPADSDEE